MANDLLKKLEEKINEAIETFELSRMEITDLKEQNEELENRYADWETRLSTLIEKFEQLENSGDVEVEEEVNISMRETEEASEEEIEASDALDEEDEEVEDSEVEEQVIEAMEDTVEEAEKEIEAGDSLDSEDGDEEEIEDLLNQAIAWIKEEIKDTGCKSN